MRQIILDTETTGLEAEQGHRIIEIGCVELLNRRVTGRRFHRYLNPERDIDEGAQAVHGISRAQLEGEPKFREIATELLEFIAGAELVIHNAAFDVGFLNAELARLEGEARRVADLCRVLDTLGSRARCTPASATRSMRCASATASTTRPRPARRAARCAAARRCLPRDDRRAERARAARRIDAAPRPERRAAGAALAAAGRGADRACAERRGARGA
jgi:DNA polymerase III epsilon subunit-like protein